MKTQKENPRLIDPAEYTAARLYQCNTALQESCHLTNDEANVVHAAIAHWDAGGQDFWLSEVAKSCALKALRGIEARYIGSPRSRPAQELKEDAILLASFFCF